MPLSKKMIDLGELRNARPYGRTETSPVSWLAELPSRFSS